MLENYLPPEFWTIDPGTPTIQINCVPEPPRPRPVVPLREVYLIDEAALYLGYEPAGLKKLVEQKLIRYAQNGTGRFRFKREWLDEFLDRLSVGPEDVDRSPARRAGQVEPLDEFDVF